MKFLKTLFTLVAAFFFVEKSYTQNINWKNLKKDDKHIATLFTGLEYGLVFGAGYGYQLKTKKPIILNIEFSTPSGNNLSDDFKTKLGGQVNLYKTKDFYFTAKAQGIFRRNENDFVRLQNFGSEISVTGGYYKRRWFTAIQIGFDKAIVTHFKHSDAYKQIYPDVKDGWYEPATGGNFNFGLLAGYTFKHSDIFLAAGKLTTQNFSNPQLPFYAQLGYIIKFRAAAKR